LKGNLLKLLLEHFFICPSKIIGPSLLLNKSTIYLYNGIHMLSCQGHLLVIGRIVRMDIQNGTIVAGNYIGIITQSSSALHKYFL